MIDAHVHFWDPLGLTYPWLEANPALHRAYLPADYAASAPNVDRMVFVECNCAPADAIKEVEFASDLALSGAPIAGIVAFTDMMELGDLDRHVESLRRFPLVKGLRHNLQGHPAGTAERFVDGIRFVGRSGLTFDICVTHDQLSETLALVRRCPDTSFILDHCGKPGIRERRLDPWRGNLARLADQANVVACKLSGLLTEAGPEWTDATVLPYMEHALACFGVERLVYGSDWPVVTLAGGHTKWYELTERFTARWSENDRRAFYHENAERVYRL